MALLMGAALSGNAQEKKATIEIPQWVKDIKLSGYGMVQYRGSDKSGDKENWFDMRLVRVSLDGRVEKDWYWKVQMQINGTPRIVDAFTEWQKYDFLCVKAGQFKRPFTFENPMHPITQGFMSYSQNVTNLAGFSDRTGEQASNGRDIGVQIQGDLLKIQGRPWLHYQLGVFSGQGINTKDVDNRKDIIGGLWVMPVKEMRIGVFGWTGSRGEKDASTGKIVSTPKNRYALSAEYVKNDYTLRTEYIHSQGYGAKGTTDKADGYYALGIMPIIKNKLHAKARYDVYRSEKTRESSKTMYEVGADYAFNKNILLFVEYARVNERATHQNYNLVDVQLDFKF